MHYVVSASASGDQRGVSHDAAMRFLHQMEQPGLTIDQIMEHYDALYRDSIVVEANARVRVISLGGSDRLVIRDVEVLGFDRVAKAMTKPKQSFDTKKAFAKFNAVGRRA
jgi:hypothetical protein